MKIRNALSIQLDNFRIDKNTLQRVLDFLPYPFLISEFKRGAQRNIYLNQKFIEELGYTLTDIPTIDDWFDKAYPDLAYRAEIMEEWELRSQVSLQQKDRSVIMKALIHTKNFDDRWYEVKSSVLAGFNSLPSSTYTRLSPKKMN